jgi:hypothetical protein
MRLLAIIASLVALLGAALTARADTVMATPIYFIGLTGTTCDATNVGNKPVTVTIQVIKYSTNGDVLEQSTQQVQPNGTIGQGAIPADATYGYCRFSGKFSKNSLRVAGVVAATSTTIPGY